MNAFYLLCNQCFVSLQGFPTREVKMGYCNRFIIFAGNTASQHTGCLRGGAGASWAQETVWCCPPASQAAFGRNSPLHLMSASSTPKYECVNLLKWCFCVQVILTCGLVHYGHNVFASEGSAAEQAKNTGCFCSDVAADTRHM